MKPTSPLNRFFSLLFPPKCLGCGAVLLDSGGILCDRCLVRYDQLYHRKCRWCGNDLCACDCTKEGIESYGVWRLGKLCAYLPKEKNSPFKGMLYSFKHKNGTDVREHFAEKMADMIRRKCRGYENFTICYVPRSIASYKKYGYDHMRELCALVARKLGMEYEDLFYREKNAKIQKELGRDARFYNARKSIMLREDADVSERRFILLDDVCVTGASLGRCATLLINENAREVRCFVIAVRP